MMLGSGSSIDNIDIDRYGKIPPAFSGIMVDWSIGTREITSTIIDLVVRGYIDAIGDRLVINRRKVPGGFEKKFLSILFGSNPSLRYEQISEIAYGKEYRNLLQTICKGMVSEGVIDRNFQKKLAKCSRETLIKIGARGEKDFEPISPKLPIIIIPSWVWYLVAGILMVVAVLAPFLHPFLFMTITFPLLLVMGLMTLQVIIVNRAIKQRFGPDLDFILTDKGKTVKSESLKLMSYMKKYPLMEDRLANILVGHAIAFGLGKQWMGKLGKNRILFLKLIEQTSSKWDTLYNFMNMRTYVNSLARP